MYILNYFNIFVKVMSYSVIERSDVSVIISAPKKELRAKAIL